MHDGLAVVDSTSTSGYRYFWARDARLTRISSSLLR
jgi:hypothetical protein